MASFARTVLSGSSEGRLITVGTSAALLHLTSSATGVYNEVYLWAVNNATHDAGCIKQIRIDRIHPCGDIGVGFAMSDFPHFGDDVGVY